MDTDRQPRKRILILAPFLRAGGFWIDDFCHRSDFEFKKAAYPNPPPSWHKRGPTTPLREWFNHLSYVYQSMKWNADCIVTCFPQLALAAALWLRLRGRSKTRLVAWNFNLGSVSNKWQGYFAGTILGRVDRFVVHARGEIGSYAEWLRLKEDRFRFIPLQKGLIGRVQPSPVQKPYIISMGSADRDYVTLVKAVRGTGIKTIIISKKTVTDLLPEHPDLLKFNGLSQEECYSILGDAVLNVVPLTAMQTASGQVTIVTSMRMGIPTIATHSVGTTDYIHDQETGLLVAPGDVNALRRAIELVWHDEALKFRIGTAAREHADKYFSDEAAGRHLEQVLDDVLADRPAVRRSLRA